MRGRENRSRVKSLYKDCSEPTWTSGHTNSFNILSVSGEWAWSTPSGGGALFSRRHLIVVKYPFDTKFLQRCVTSRER